tara:strand:- start:310 stop:1497 length:1188 start_codon:yes stop_codon:yes gene_type:complete
MKYKKNISRLHTKQILIVLITALFIVVTFNILTVSFLKTKENIATAQMIPGWGRQYKPIMHDILKPEAVAFGASWVRDAFDPILSESLIGFTFFNHGISGGTSYETKRFVQSAISSSSMKHAYLNVESFYDAPEGSKKQYGFDENNLLIKKNGEPNVFVRLNRFKNLYTSGASINFNFQLIKARIKLMNGESIATISPSFQSINWTQHQSKLKEITKEIFSPNGPTSINQSIKTPTFNDLKETVTILCEKNINVHVYETPHHSIFKGCNNKYNHTNYLRIQLEALKPQCGSNLTYHSFLYPNAITLEGIDSNKNSSIFFRPDGHPTPYLGLEMLKEIHSIKSDSTSNLIDFGTNLMDLSLDQTRNWIDRRKGRCQGNWSKEDLIVLGMDKDKLNN